MYTITYTPVLVTTKYVLITMPLETVPQTHANLSTSIAALFNPFPPALGVSGSDM